MNDKLKSKQPNLSTGEKFINSNDAEIWTISTGNGSAAMFCSGGPGCCDYLEPIAQMLDDKSQVIRFEQRGCGRSQAVPPYDIETCLIDLENIRKAYKINRWIIGGHSWGADLALFYALKYPDKVAGLICISGGRIHNDREWSQEYKRRKETQGEFVPEFKYPTNLEVNKLVNNSWKHYIQNPDLLRAISNLKTPSLFVYGDRDIRPGWAVEQIANLMPNARFKLIQGAEHVIWKSHAEKLKMILRDFVNEIS